MKRILSIFVLFIFLWGTGLIQLSHAQVFNMENPLIGTEAADFTLSSIKSGKVNFTKIREGKSAILFFWATWCPHCRRELGELSEQAAQIEKKGIKIILIDIGETTKQVSSYLQKQNINFDVILDENQSLSEKYGLVGVPTLFFVNKNGKIKAVEYSFPENYEEILSRE